MISVTSRFVLPGLLTAMLSACGKPDYGPPASEATKGAAIRSWLLCLDEQAGRFDDGLSDARTVGRAIAPRCRDQFIYAIDLESQGKNANVRAMVRERLLAREVDEAAESVLRRRARLRRS